MRLLNHSAGRNEKYFANARWKLVFEGCLRLVEIFLIKSLKFISFQINFLVAVLKSSDLLKLDYAQASHVDRNIFWFLIKLFV